MKLDQFKLGFASARGCVAALLSLGVLSAASLPVAAADMQDRNFKIAIAVNAGTAHYDGGVKFCELLDKKSGGKMKAKMYGGGALGKDTAVVSSMQGGIIDMAIMNANLLTGLVKDYGVLDFPFAFANEKIAYKVLDGEWGSKLSNKLQDKGLVGLGFWEMGYLNYHSGKKPINKVEDIAGLKMRVTETPLQIDFQNVLGANAVPLPFVEVYTALEQHTVDGGNQTLINLEKSKFYEVQKFVTITNHMYNPQILLISKKVYDKLSADEKKVLGEAAAEARDYQRQLSQKYGAEALAFLKTKMTVSVMPPEEVAKMKEKTKPLIDKYSKQYGEQTAREMYAEIDKASKAK